MERKTNRKQIFLGLILLFFLTAACVVVYKAQIRGKLEEPVEYTMMTEHKDTAEIVLSGEWPEFYETFQCRVPELRSFSLELTGKKVIDEASLVMTLYDVDTEEIYYQAEKSVRAVLDSRVQGRAEFTLSEPVRDSAGKELCLVWKLENAGTTSVHLTSNQKQVIVSSFNALEGNRTNVIYSLSYGDSQCLFVLYVLLCGLLLLFAAICWWMIVIKQMSVERFFVPMALFLGMIFQCLITVGGVPDEPGHLDTAYKYSNKLLFVEDTGSSHTIYKRVCDAEMSDMLANGLESNSYYQLMTDTFRSPDHTDLTEVSYVDSTNLVPGIVYFPAALGITAGRLLGLSAMLTLQLARVFNLICFVLLAWTAVRLLPFGKNLLGMTAMLPIALQQGASFSYDAIVNGAMLVFVALCFRMGSKKQKEKREILLVVFLAAFTAVAKGGVYLPLLLLVIPAFLKSCDIRKAEKKKVILWFGFGLAAAILLAAVAAVKFMPVFQTFMGGAGQSGDTAAYTIPYLARHPLKIVYLYWNTIMEEGDVLLQGLLGGVLSWLDIRTNWIFQLIFLVCLLLAANREKDRYQGGRRGKLLIVVSCGISVVLIMMSMLVGYTKMGADYIQGLQGRYFLPLAFPLFCLTANRMVLVRKNQGACIWMTMMATEVLLVLQVAAMVG